MQTFRLATMRNGIVFCGALLAALTLSARAAETIKPNIGEPLRDAAVVRGPDGTYYLTGTTTVPGQNGQPDFNNCRGMRVWSSKDLQSWQDLGLVWDRWDPKQNLTRGKGVHLGWGSYQGELLPLPGLTPGERACGMTAPRLSFDDGRFWVGYSVCGFAGGAMSTEGANIKGPWNDHRLLAEAHGAETDRSDAQVFMDRDGTRYLVWGGGCIAKLRPRAELLAINNSDAGFGQVGVTGEVQYLPALIDGWPGDDGLPEHGDPHGAFVFLDGDRYGFVFTATTLRDGGLHEDAYLCRSAKLFGPYSLPVPFVLDAGRSSVFADAAGKLRVVHSTPDNQPVILSYPPAPVKLAPQKAIPAKRGEIATKAPALPPSDKPQDVPQDVEMIAPLFDHPLRDAAICRGGDGAWYMVGTEASQGAAGKLDWANNNGIRLWRSTDMKTWEDKGYVWDCDKDGGDWAKVRHLDRTCGAQPRLGRAVTAPEIHFLNGTFWIVYSMNGQGIGLLQSTTGQAAGPYRDLGRLTRQGRDPSLFQDGETVYLVWGQGFYAKLSEDLTKLAGPVKALFANVKWYPRYLRRLEIMGQWGSHLVKAGNWYIWNFTTRTGRSGINSIDTMASWSKSLAGPWGEPCVMLVNGGQSTLVADGAGEFFATVSGEDELAQCPYLPAITEVHSRGTLQPYPTPRSLSELPSYAEKNCQASFYAANSVQATELDFWVGNPKFLPCGIRDVWVGRLDDSEYYYLTGSFWAQKSLDDKCPFFRSKDLIHWGDKPVAVACTLEDARKWPGMDVEKLNQGLAKRQAQAEKSGRKAEEIQSPFQCAENKGFRYGKDIYALSFFFGLQAGLLKSTSRTMAGPWERVNKPPFGILGLDQDGSVLVNTPGWIARVPKGVSPEKIDFQKLEKHEFVHEKNLSMEEDCEVGNAVIDGKYMTWSADWNGNYDMQYRIADSIEGPWRSLRVGAPHGGNGQMFQRADGSWWYAGFYNCNDFATRVGDSKAFLRLFIMPLWVGWQDGDLIIEPQAVRANRARLEQLGALWQTPRGGSK